jgi:hypothetical protein
VTPAGVAKLQAAREVRWAGGSQQASCVQAYNYPTSQRGPGDNKSLREDERHPTVLRVIEQEEKRKGLCPRPVRARDVSILLDSFNWP